VNTSRESRSLVVLTVVAAVLLSLLPLPDVIAPFKPYWVALVVIYWALETYDMVGLGGAFFAGLLLDVLSGSLMGMHALSLVIMVFLVQRFRPRLRFFPPWQQALSVLALLLNDRIILIWVTTLLGEPLPMWQYWLPPIVALAIWPWLFLLLDRVRAGARQRSS
jgi:rod shape-determining protein MreD